MTIEGAVLEDKDVLIRNDVSFIADGVCRPIRPAGRCPFDGELGNLERKVASLSQFPFPQNTFFNPRLAFCWKSRPFYQLFTIFPGV